jgi:anti-anti-sigma factor
VTDASYPDTLINGVPVVTTPAEIDITTADQLRAALLHAAGNRHPVVVADMTGTRFCDSAALQALTAAYERARADGGELRLVTPAAGTVPRVLALTGIDRFIPCFASLEEALAKAPDGTNPATGPTRTSHASI